jgi:DNA-binding LytR/AlgR family response regulator
MNTSKIVNRRIFVTASLISVTGVGTYAFSPNQVTSERFVAWAKGQTRLKNAKPRRQPKSEQIQRYSVEITNYLDEDRRRTIDDSFVYDRMIKIDQLITRLVAVTVDTEEEVIAEIERKLNQTTRSTPPG